MGDKLIEHEGVVKNIDDQNAIVNLVNVATCSSCHAKSVCAVSETDNKEITVATIPHLKEGEKVTLSFNESMGPKALFLSYTLPFLVLFLALILAWNISGDELLSGLVALSTLVPYYLILSLFKNKLKRTFSFQIKKMEAGI